MRSVSDTAAGEFAEIIMAGYSQMDNRLRAERTVEGMRTAQARGRWTHQAPIGYLNGPKGGPSLVPDPQRAPLIIRGFEMLGTGNRTLIDALRALRAQGLTTRRGRRVSVQTFHRVVRNGIYTGRLATSWGVDTAGDWDPLITEDLFDRVQMVLDGRRPSLATPARVRHRPEFPLKGHVRCERCGKPLTGESKRNGTLHYYRCRTPGCLSTVAKRKVEDAYEVLLDSVRLRPEYVRLFREITLQAHRERHASEGKERKRLEKRRDDLQAQKLNLGRELARGTLDAASYRELRDEIDRDLAEARVALTEATSREIDVEGILDFAEATIVEPVKTWRNLGPRQKRVLQAAFFPAGVTFDGKVCRTDLTASFLAELRQIQEGNTRLASPTGVEPVSGRPTHESVTR
jgi:hypothetical protein